MDKKIMELSGKKHFNSVIKYRKIAAFRLHTFFRHKDEMLCVTFSVENSSVRPFLSQRKTFTMEDKSKKGFTLNFGFFVYLEKK